MIEEAQALGEPPEDPLLLFSALYGSWAANIVAFNGDVMHELAVEFLALAKNKRDGPAMVGHRLMGLTLFHAGKIADGRAHLDRAIALYDPAEHLHLATRFGQDVGATGLAWRSFALWCSATPRTHSRRRARPQDRAREPALRDPDLRAEFQHFPHLSCGNFTAANALIDEFAY